MNITNSELETIVDDFRSQIGVEWLNAQAAATKGRHLPLVEWFGLLDNTPRNDWSKLEVAVQIATLAIAIQELRAGRVTGVEDRVKELWRIDSAKFHSTCQELVVASEYLRSGHQVTFVPESRIRQYDILVDGEVEVECKYKVRDSPKDIARYVLYNRLTEEADAALRASNQRTMLIVEAIFRKEPQDSDVDELVAVIKRAAADARFAMEARDHGRVAYKVVADPNSRTADGTAISEAWAKHYEYIRMSGDATPQADGTIAIAKVLKIGVKCEVIQDRLLSLGYSFQNAITQFSGTLPAVIHVDITSVLPKLEHAEAAHRQETIDNFLRDNIAISAIVLEHDHVETSATATSTVRRSEIWWNRAAQYPMPARLRARFEASGDNVDRPQADPAVRE